MSLRRLLSALTHNDREKEDVDHEDDDEHEDVFDDSLANVAAQQVKLGLVHARSSTDDFAAGRLMIVGH